MFKNFIISALMVALLATADGWKVAGFEKVLISLILIFLVFGVFQALEYMAKGGAKHGTI